jgi:nucleoside-diphosphate-sugar epimerase
MTSSPVLVTGATGFVGAHLTRRLVADGHQVHVMHRTGRDESRLAGVRDHVVMHTVDLRDAVGIETLVDVVQPRCVFHLAAAAMHGGRAASAAEQTATNLGGAVSLMDACRHTELDAFVNVGDAFEYGPGDGPVAETAPCRPTTLDGITKLGATFYGRALAESTGAPVVTVRPFSIVGPADDPRRLVPLLVAAARSGAALTLSDRRIVRDFVWVDDVIELLLGVAAQASNLRGEVLNCGSGRATTLGDLLERVARVTGVALDATWGAFPIAPHDLHHPVADVTAAATRLGWKPATPLDEMLTRLWADGARGQPDSHEPERPR